MSHFEVQDNSKGEKAEEETSKDSQVLSFKTSLQRLFMSSKTAEHMRWHEVDKNEDGKLRHPWDVKAWKVFDSDFLNFAADPRNVRLTLATDIFNLFGNLSTSYSIWPVVFIPYNLPPRYI